MFITIENIISKMTDIYSHYFEAAAKIHSGDFIYGYDEYNPGYPKIPIVHPIVLEIIVMVFSTIDIFNEKYISDTTNLIIREKDLNVPSNFRYVNRDDIVTVFKELSEDGKLIKQDNSSFVFADTYCKSYTFLQFANFCGEEMFKKFQRDRISSIRK